MFSNSLNLLNEFIWDMPTFVSAKSKETVDLTMLLIHIKINFILDEIKRISYFPISEFNNSNYMPVKKAIKKPIICVLLSILISISLLLSLHFPQLFSLQH